MKNKRIVILVVIGIIWISFKISQRPHVVEKDNSSISVLADPNQVLFSGAQKIEKDIKGGQYTLSLAAEYELAGVVVSKKFYSSGRNSQVAPVDLAVVWGRLADEECDKYMRYSQSNRWYYYQYSKDCPCDSKYIINHSSNNHIIPANPNILRAVRSIKRKQKIILYGYLVRLKGVYKGNDMWWNTSLTRSDTGDSSCEVFYVEKVRVGNNIYK